MVIAGCAAGAGGVPPGAGGVPPGAGGVPPGAAGAVPGPPNAFVFNACLWKLSTVRSTGANNLTAFEMPA